MRAAEIQVTVEGCLRGSQLRRMLYQTQSAEQAMLNATEFVLTGQKELMRILTRDHDGHQEIISGIAIIPPSPDGVGTDSMTKKVGPGKVSVGVRQKGAAGAATSVPLPDAPGPVRIRVQSATHVADRCVSR